MEGKVVIITGASSGIGAGAAVLFSSRGASVVLCGRKEGGLQETAAACKAQGASDDQILIVKSDLTIEADLDLIVNSTIQKYGRIDILINNAGVPGSGNISSCTEEILETAMDVNTRAPFFLTQKCVPYLAKAKGNVINVSSTAGIRVNPIMIGYCCSKRGLDQFTKALALELGPKGIRVNSVNPSTVEDTEMVQKHGSFVEPEKKEEYFQLMRSGVPLKRLCQVKDVVESIFFLASESSAFVTGYLHPVDGGYRNTKRGAFKKFEKTVKH